MSLGDVTTELHPCTSHVWLMLRDGSPGKLFCTSGWLSVACYCPIHQKTVNWGSDPKGTVRPFLGGGNESAKGVNRGTSSNIVLLKSSTTILSNGFTIPACSHKDASFKAIWTAPGQELRFVLDNTVQFKSHKAGLQGHYRAMTGNLLVAKMTIKGSTYFKGANHYLVLVNL